MSIQGNKKAAIALSKDQRKHKWKSEMIFKKMLTREGVDNVHQKPFYTEFWFYSGDFFIPKLKILIELDGKGHSKRRAHDLKRSQRLVVSGKVKEVIRIKNSHLIQRPREVYKQVIEIRNRLWDGEPLNNN